METSKKFKTLRVRGVSREDAIYAAEVKLIGLQYTDRCDYEIIDQTVVKCFADNNKIWEVRYAKANFGSGVQL